jgi:endonuclease/exonuclease/phosphatase family metal-dependent hydrolase
MGGMAQEHERRNEMRRTYRRLIQRVRRPPQAPEPPPDPGTRALKIISWNLLRLTGATLDDVARLVRRHRPDILLMQEATAAIDALAEQVGGCYWRTLQPGRIHGLAVWSPRALPYPPMVLPLPAGSLFERVCQIVDLDGIGIANVHLSHGQVLNRRQLRRIARVLPQRAAVLGDYNLVGPALLPGFEDVGPRHPTHVMGEIVPLRIDRCLVRGLTCLHTAVLPRRRSDHRPIIVTLDVAAVPVLLEAA